MKQKIITLGILAALILGVGLMVNQIKPGSKATLNASSSTNSVGVNNQYATTTVKAGLKSFVVEIATTPDQQSLGLGNRDRLVKNAGMLFVFKPADEATFWMKDMRFPLDMIWIYQGRIIAIDRDLPVPKPDTLPAKLPTYSPKTLIDYVLEVNAGEGTSLKIGDHFELVTSFST